MKKYSISLIFASILFLSWTAFSPSSHSIENLEENWEQKISPQLMTKALRGEKLDFLVLLKKQAEVSAAKNLKTKTARGNFVYQKLKQDAHVSQKNILSLLNNTQAVYQSFYIINALQVKGDFDLLKKIAQLPEIKKITDNSPIQLEEPMEKSATNARGPNAIEWGIDMINADEVWAQGFRGQNVVVGGQDTGYEWTHPAIVKKYRGGEDSTANHNYNWHDAIHELSANNTTANPCGLNTQKPCDDNNHGTHTMGTMVGEDGENQIGVAPEAKWIACRNMERGSGTPATYIECFEWFMAPTDLNNENADVSKAPHVIANSWSCPVSEGCDSTNWDVMEMVVNNLKSSGVVVVVSAGNSGNQGCGSVSTPAAIFEPSFTVGATNMEDLITGFSSRGPVTVNGSGITKPNVSAPGRQVRSCIRDSSYATYSGTSMAGPHVAGMVALIISANPNLAGRVEEIEDIIEATAVPKTDTMDCGGISSMQIPNNVYGFGRVDALAAVEAALLFTDVDDFETTTATVNIFPNPSEGWVALEIENMVGETTFELFDVSGRLLKTYEWNLTNYQVEQVDLTALSSGVYFYKMKNEKEELTGKIVRK